MMRIFVLINYESHNELTMSDMKHMRFQTADVGRFVCFHLSLLTPVDRFSVPRNNILTPLFTTIRPATPIYSRQEVVATPRESLCDSAVSRTFLLFQPLEATLRYIHLLAHTR